MVHGRPGGTAPRNVTLNTQAARIRRTRAAREAI
jgi:hypothetical protein